MRKIIPMAMATLLLVACGSSEEAEPQALDMDDEALTITGENGERVQVAGGDAAVSALPEGFSAYPGAQVVSSTAVSSGTGGGVILVMNTADSAEEVIEYYRTQATAAGVRIEGEVSTGATRLIGGEGPGGLAFSASASPGADGTVVQLTVGRDGE